MKAALVSMAFIVLAGCSGAGSGPPVEKIDQVVLLDVHALWGGVGLWIAGDGKAVCSFVAPPGPEAKGATTAQESRHELALTAEQLAALVDLINKHRFFAFEIENRAGIPDEARPIIFVKAGAQARAVGKWANDRHQDFDPIYLHLKQLAESGKSGQPVFQGDYSYWSPPGFPPAKSLIEQTIPKLD